MPQTPHIERHFTSGDVVRDVVIGMSDGLTVPFALAAGLSGAVQATSIVVTAGVAELAAGAIAMGLGGFLAARSDAEHYASERRREVQEVATIPAAEEAEVAAIFGEYGLSAMDIAPVIAVLREHPRAWADFMMRFELGMEAPDPRRALISAVTIGGAYVVGGLIPLGPYFFVETARAALPVSIVVTLIALFIFGCAKAKFTGARVIRSGLQTILVGGLAASAAFLLAHALS